MRWKPKEGQKFWFVLGEVTSYLEVRSIVWHEFGDKEDLKTNCFRTKKEALSAKRAILKVLGGGK